MDDIARRIIDKLGQPGLYIAALILLVLLLLIAVLFVHAYKTGRKFKLGPIEIEGKESSPSASVATPSSRSTQVKTESSGWEKRIMLLCGTTDEINNSPA